MTVAQSGPAPRGPVAEEAVLARLEALGTGCADVPGEGFRIVTRGRLVAMAAVRSPAAPRGRLRRLLAPHGAASHRRRLTAVVAAAVLALAGTGGLLAAAQGPGLATCSTRSSAGASRPGWPWPATPGGGTHCWTSPPPGCTRPGSWWACR